MDGLRPGEVLTVLATDPEAPIDLAGWAHEAGHAYAEHRRAGWIEFELRKGPHGTSTAVPPRRGSPPPDASPVRGSRATACTPPK